MDEMRMIGDMLDEPPTERAAAAGRRRLHEEIADASGRPGGSGGRAGARTGARRGIPRFTLFSGLGLLAAGAAAAVAISVIGPGAPPSSGGGTVQPAPVDLGRRAVLAAAENAAKQEIGEYWFTDEVGGQSYVVRAETGTYVMVGAHMESFRWTSAESGSDIGIAARMLPARPQTAEDAAAWKRAGSPTKIKVWSSDKYLTMDTSEEPVWSAGRTDYPRKYGRHYAQMTAEELRKLPTDPERLTEMFLTDEAVRWRSVGASSAEEFAEMEKERGRPFPVPILDSQTKMSVVESWLSGSPVPPKVRAGLMRALTELPGVRAIGEVVDPLGRRGVALASESRTPESGTTETPGESDARPEGRAAYGSRLELVFDRETGELLAGQRVLTEPGGPYKDREPGFVISYTAMRDMGWTDTRPEPPAEPPTY